MQSDPGAGTPHTGDDDEVWRDLVSRLEEPDDSFLDDGPDATAPGGTNGTGTPGTGRNDGGTPGRAAPEPKTVIDFDPLGVWHGQATPAPREPAADSRFASPAGATGDGNGSFGPRDYDAEEDDGDFVPEELPSLRNSDPAIMMSWIGAAGGPLFLVFSAIFWRQAPTLLVVAVIMAFIAGTGYLLFRLPNHRDHGDGDGAVV